MPEHTIAENLARLQAAKTAIGNAIVAKGGTVNSGDGLEEYPTDIASIETAELTSISITENGVYSSGDAEEVESSNLPIVIEADGTPLSDFLISGNMSQTGTPTPASPIQPSECGELETIGAKAGQYKIPILSANITTNVYLGEVPTTRKIKKYEFTGNETFYASSQTSVFYTTAISNLCNKTVTYNTGCIINAYKIRKQSTAANLLDGEFTTDANAYLWFRNYDYATLADFQSYLATQYANGTPVTVWYVLATEETGIVNEPLRKIGNYADTLSMTQAGVQIPTNTSPSTTTIDILTTLPPSLLYVEYNTLSTTSGYNIVDVNVPNTYSSSDEGKVVLNRQLIPQTAKPDTIITNNTYDTTNYNSVTVDVENSYTASDEGKVVNNGALVLQTAKPDTITTNSTYNTMLYSSVTVNVENSYSASDEGKVVSNGALVSQTAMPTAITTNDTYNTTTYNSVTVDVPNTYTQSDEGKVVNNGSLVAQTAKPTEITANDTYDTTMYNSVTVDVANTYTQSDEGKVVSNGELVAQTAKPDVVVANGVYNTTLYNSVNVSVASELQTRKDVNFYDYEGTVVKSYTAAEFANISELPDNPSHEGLTAQGWNWSLVDAKAYVAKYGKLNIGQMYITDDGKTRIYLTLTDGATSPKLELYLNDNTELDIDWGDGSTHSTFTTTTARYKSEMHEYAVGGEYVIAIAVIQGSFVIQSDTGSSYYISTVITGGYNISDAGDDSPNTYYRNSVRKIELGNYVTIGEKAFSYIYSLMSITIPNSITTIKNRAFYNVYSLLFVVIPNSVTTIEEYAFNNCINMAGCALPNSVTTTGEYALAACYSMLSVTIPDSIINISSNFLDGNFTLSSVIIPDSLANISNIMFSRNYSLTSITIPDSVVSIGSLAFSGCRSLASITIPDSVTSIGGSAFNNCYSLLSIKFESTTPPTVSNSNAWTNVPTDCKIYVPVGTLNAYKTATNYPNPSTYTYVEY